MTVNKQYFMANEATKEAILASWKEKYAVVGELKKELLAKFGTDRYFGSGDSISYVLYDSRTAPIEGMRLDQRALKKGHTFLIDEKKMYCHSPDCRTKVGKDLKRDIREYNLKIQNLGSFSDHILKRYDQGFCSHVVGGDSGRTGLTMYITVAGMKRDNLFIIRPIGGEEEKVQPVPAPEGFTEIKKSKYIELTEE